MTEEMKKRLEEAAIEYADNHGFRIPYDGSNNFYDDIDVKVSKEGFLAGAEYGYKEAIEQAKEWLKGHLDSDTGESCSSLDNELLADFEADMTKLWEEEK